MNSSRVNPDSRYALPHCLHNPDERRAIPQLLQVSLTVCGLVTSPVNSHVD